MGVTEQEIQDLRDLMQKYCFEYGDFTLSSGRTSKYYYDGKRATLSPVAARMIGGILAEVILPLGVEAVGGLEIGSVPISSAVGQAALEFGRELPLFIVRKKPKSHGTRDLVARAFVEDDDLLREGRQVAIVDDVITGGGSVQKAIDAVEAQGCKVVLVVVLVERHEGGGDALRERGYDVLSIFRTDEEGQLSINDAFLQRLAAGQTAVD